MQALVAIPLQPLNLPGRAVGRLQQPGRPPRLGLRRGHDGQGHGLRPLNALLHRLAQLVPPAVHQGIVRPRAPAVPGLRILQEFVHRLGAHKAAHGVEAPYILIVRVIEQQHRRADGRAGHGAVQAAGHDVLRPGVTIQHGLGGLHALMIILGRIVHLMGDGLHVLGGKGVFQGMEHVLRHVAANDALPLLPGDFHPVQGQGHTGGQLAGQMHALHQRNGHLVPAPQRRQRLQIRQARSVQVGHGDAPYVLPGEVRAHHDRRDVPFRRPVDGLGQHLAAHQRHHPVVRLQVGQGRVQPVNVQSHVHPGQQPRGRQGQQIIAQVVGSGPPGHSIADHCLSLRISRRTSPGIPPGKGSRPA